MCWDEATGHNPREQSAISSEAVPSRKKKKKRKGIPGGHPVGTEHNKDASPETNAKSKEKFNIDKAQRH